LLQICTFTYTMLRYILLALAIYLGYKLVFDVIVPVYRASKKIRRQFNSMHQQMQDQMNATQNTYPGNKDNPPEQRKTTPGDYIDFEEVK
jgi:hypothetical protein